MYRYPEPMFDMIIREDDLQGPAIRAFLRDHLDHMYAITPPESVHALDVDSLLAPGITFWSAWAGADLVGCGALKERDPASGEVKSMRTSPAQRGRGIGARVLEHIITVAQRRGYRHLYLETGAMPEFAPARALYQRYGFVYCDPFPPYRPDPNSVFMVKCLDKLW